MPKSLPAEFADLAVFTDKWVLPSEADRHRTRLACDFGGLKALYDAMLPRMDAIVIHLNGHDLKALPEAERNLFGLSLSFIEVSTSIELFKEPTVPDGFDFRRFKVWM
jgi:hypothetical protein